MKRSCYPSACQAALPALAPTRPPEQLAPSSAQHSTGDLPAWPRAAQTQADPCHGAQGRFGEGSVTARRRPGSVHPVETPSAGWGPLCCSEPQRQAAGAVCVGSGDRGSSDGQERRVALATARGTCPAAGNARGSQAAAAICHSPRLQQALCHPLYLSPSPDVASDRC